jgi:hypothetical protein
MVWKWTARDVDEMDEQARKYVPKKHKRYLSSGAGKWVIQQRKFLKQDRV